MKYVVAVPKSVLLVATLATLIQGINVSISIWNLPIIPDIWSVGISLGLGIILIILGVVFSIIG
jgi:hypothetical protein